MEVKFIFTMLTSIKNCYYLNLDLPQILQWTGPMLLNADLNAECLFLTCGESVLLFTPYRGLPFSWSTEGSPFHHAQILWWELNLNPKTCMNVVLIRSSIYVTGWMFKSNGTTSVSIPRLVVDKVKLLSSSEMFLIQSILFDIRVPNKSLSPMLCLYLDLLCVTNIVH